MERDGTSIGRALLGPARPATVPAALLVLALTTIATFAFLPPVYWQQTFKEIAASTLYVQNWALASDSVDYLATASNIASPVQYFWSLSVEEQFYLVWPLLFLFVGLIGSRLARGPRQMALFVVLATVVVTSLSYSVIRTATDPAPAYFVTPTRAWEFAAGGLVAFAPGFREHRMAMLSWLGWLGIAAVAFAFTGRTPFPSYWAVLPVLGAALVIWAGRPNLSWAPHHIFAIRPVVFLGGISYSVYLWHWPILVFASFAVTPTPVWLKLLLIGAVILIAGASTRLIENPVRSNRILTGHRPLWTFAATVVAMALVFVPTASTWTTLHNQAVQDVAAAARAAQEKRCFGAGYRDPEQDCAGVHYTALIPSPTSAVEDQSDVYQLRCIVGNGGRDLRICHRGPANGKLRVAVIGDSHAVHWLPAIDQLAEQRDWSVTTFFKSACPQSAAPKTLPVDLEESCREWNEKLATELAKEKPFDLVFVSHALSSDKYGGKQQEIAGFQASWKTLTDRHAEVLVVRDAPRMSSNTNSCLDANEHNPSMCDRPESVSLIPDVMIEAAKGQPRVHAIDLNGYLCWDGTCKASVGGVVGYRDDSHLTETLAITFAPILGRALDQLKLNQG